MPTSRHAQASGLAALAVIGWLGCGAAVPATAVGGNANQAQAPNATDANVVQSANEVVLGQGNVLLSGSGFDAYDGKIVYASILTTGARVVATAHTGVANGQFTVPFLLSIADGYGQQVAYVVDVNGNGFCNLAPTDVGGNQTVPADGKVAVTPQTAQKPLCEALGVWSLNVSGTGFTAASGHAVVLAVRDLQDNSWVLGPRRVPSSDGSFSTSFAAPLIAGHAYEVRLFADAKGDGTCQDNGWAFATGTVQDDVNLAVSATAARTSVCGDFPSL